MQKQFDTVIRAMRSTLEEAGVGDLFFMKHGSMRILPEKISCDVYRLFRGDPEAVNSYRGESLKHSINGPPERRVKQTDHRKDGQSRQFRSGRLFLNDVPPESE